MAAGVAVPLGIASGVLAARMLVWAAWEHAAIDVAARSTVTMRRDCDVVMATQFRVETRPLRDRLRAQ